MPVTIKQIAEYAGVSRGTVDRALNNRDGINADVAKRICKIAEELGYTPNRAGKALASRNNPIQVGVLLNSIGNPFYEEVLEGLYAAQKEYSDFSMKMHLRQLKGYHVEEQLAEIDRLVEQGVHAIALTPLNDTAVADKINWLTAHNIAVVKLNANIENTEDALYIGCDYEQSGATAAGLLGLLTHGAAKVGIITGSVKMLGHNQRIHGFIGACRSDFPSMEIAEMVECNDEDETSYCVTLQILQNSDISALYFVSGGVSGGIRAVQEANRARRPAIVCCDATAEIRRLMQENWIDATVCQQPYEQGFLSIQTIFNRLMTGKFETHMVPIKNEIKIKFNL